MNLRKSNNGYTALHKAAIIGDVTLVQMLIDKGADTEICDNEQMTPLHRYVSRAGVRGYLMVLCIIMP